jgi:hypothetical protein
MFFRFWFQAPNILFGKYVVDVFEEFMSDVIHFIMDQSILYVNQFSPSTKNN